MGKLLAGIIASVLVVGSAAAAYKLEPLTNEQRMELRARAEKLVAEREAHANHTNTGPEHKAMHHKTMHHGRQYHHKAATTS